MKLLEYILHFFNEYGISRLVTQIESKLYNLCRSVILEKYNITCILDERSAGYVTIGMYEESEIPILLVVDEVNMRNIAPAITEAFYRKFPIIIISITNRTLNNSQYPHDMFKSINRIDSSMNQKQIDSMLKDSVHQLDLKGGGPIMLCINDDNNNIITNSDTTNINYTYRHGYTMPSTSIYSNKIKNILKNLDYPNVYFYIDTQLLSDDVLGTTTINKVEFNSGIYSEEGLLSVMIGSSYVSHAKQFVFIGTASSIMREINVLGNRHITNNISVCIVDNNKNYSTTLAETCKTWGYTIYNISIDGQFDNIKKNIISNTIGPNIIIIQ